MPRLNLNATSNGSKTCISIEKPVGENPIHLGRIYYFDTVKDLIKKGWVSPSKNK